jgi:hypothetical protein
MGFTRFKDQPPPSPRYSPSPFTYEEPVGLESISIPPVVESALQDPGPMNRDPPRSSASPEALPSPTSHTTARGAALCLWVPGKVIGRLPATHRPASKCSFVVPAGAAAWHMEVYSLDPPPKPTQEVTQEPAEGITQQHTTNLARTIERIRQEAVRTHPDFFEFPEWVHGTTQRNEPRIALTRRQEMELWERNLPARSIYLDLLPQPTQEITQQVQSLEPMAQVIAPARDRDIARRDMTQEWEQFVREVEEFLDSGALSLETENRIMQQFDSFRRSNGFVLPGGDPRLAFIALVRGVRLINELEMRRDRREQEGPQQATTERRVRRQGQDGAGAGGSRAADTGGTDSSTRNVTTRHHPHLQHGMHTAGSSTVAAPPPPHAPSSTDMDRPHAFIDGEFAEFYTDPPALQSSISAVDSEGMLADIHELIAVDRADDVQSDFSPDDDTEDSLTRNSKRRRRR